MSGTTNAVRTSTSDRAGDRRSARRAATQAEIVDAAWQLVRSDGLASLSLRELGARVGMKAQSLYSYFPSKDAIYDAMFRQGVEQHLATMAPADDETPADEDAATDPVAVAIERTRRFFRFCTSDPVRYQLLFQRTIPGFEPSPESYALAVEALQGLRDDLAALGIVDPQAVDLWTAMVTGLTDQQISNDPGGDRWDRLIDRAVRMLLAELAPHLLAQATEHTTGHAAGHANDHTTGHATEHRESR